MKIVLDECVAHGLRPLLIGHDVFTVKYLGWSGIKNGQLLRTCGENGFDGLITIDRSMPSQQNLQRLPVSLVLIKTRNGRLKVMKPLVPQLLKILATLPPKSFVTIAPQ